VRSLPPRGCVPPRCATCQTRSNTSQPNHCASETKKNVANGVSGSSAQVGIINSNDDWASELAAAREDLHSHHREQAAPRRPPAAGELADGAAGFTTEPSPQATCPCRAGTVLRVAGCKSGVIGAAAGRGGTGAGFSAVDWPLSTVRPGQAGADGGGVLLSLRCHVGRLRFGLNRWRKSLWQLAGGTVP
jgi:hypothetical protein